MVIYSPYTSFSILISDIVTEVIMEDAFLVFGWGSPIGIGFFLVCLGAMIFFLSRAGNKSKKE
jgi:hypothetical protein